MLDDDYTGFQIRFNHRFEFVNNVIDKSLDKFFDVVLDYFISVDNLKSICFSQGGDWFGGGNGAFGEKVLIKRKAMNSFFCSVNRRFMFLSRLNEDVNTYLSLGNRGELFFTINQLQLNQLAAAFIVLPPPFSYIITFINFWIKVPIITINSIILFLSSQGLCFYVIPSAVASSQVI